MRCTNCGRAVDYYRAVCGAGVVACRRRRCKWLYRYIKFHGVKDPI